MEDAKNDVPQIILGRLVLGVRICCCFVVGICLVYTRPRHARSVSFPLFILPRPAAQDASRRLKTPQDKCLTMSQCEISPSLLDGQSPDTLLRTDRWKKKKNRVASPASDLVDGVNVCIQVNQAIVSLEYSYCRCALFFPD